MTDPTIKTTIFPLFICQIPRVNLTEVGSNTVRNVKQRILLVDLTGMGWLHIDQWLAIITR